MGWVLLCHIFRVIFPAIGGPATPMENNLAIVFATAFDYLVDVFAFVHFTGFLAEFLHVIESSSERREFRMSAVTVAVDDKGSSLGRERTSDIDLCSLHSCEVSFDSMFTRESFHDMQ